MVIQPLDSADNKTVRLVRRLQGSQHSRSKTQETIVEGGRLVDEVLSSGIEPRVVLYSPKWVERAEGRSLLARLAARSIHLLYVTDRLYGEMSQVEASQGIMAVIRVPDFAVLDRFLDEAIAPLLFPVLVGIQDPGNLGTLIRTALAAGAQGVGIGPGTVSPFNPKSIRASAGSLFRLPLVSFDQEDIQRLREREVQVLLTAPDGGKAYFESDFKPATAILLGNEGNGLSSEWLALADVITIPMSPASESLNVSIAGSVLLFHAAYVRQKHGIGFQPPVMV